MRNPRVGLIASAVIVLVFTACSVAATEGVYTGQAQDELRAFKEAELPDWSEVGDLRSGDLRQGEFKRDTLQLVGGSRVGVLASCDDQCGDLDLQIEDEYGFILQREADDAAKYPFVEFTTDSETLYVLRVNMEQCDASPCFYTYLLLENPSGPDDE